MADRALVHLYSLRASMDAVIRYLATVDPEAERRARARYACFDHVGEAKHFDAVIFRRDAGAGAAGSVESVEAQRPAGGDGDLSERDLTEQERGAADAPRNTSHATANRRV
ncbi:erythromycin esterase family protein [Aromatoleum sp.]|uniref:erythromycin esterase family protein n=1 Tax=Aromatoleum sp. TaxID=2307007 RepID=UPI002FCAE312